MSFVNPFISLPLIECVKGTQKLHIMSYCSASAVNWCDQYGHELTVLSLECVLKVTLSSPRHKPQNAG